MSNREESVFNLGQSQWVLEADNTSISILAQKLTNEELWELEDHTAASEISEIIQGNTQSTSIKNENDRLHEETFDSTKSSEILSRSKLNGYKCNSETEFSNQRQLLIDNGNNQGKEDGSSSTDIEEFSFREDILFETDTEDQDTSDREGSSNSNEEESPAKGVIFDGSTSESSVQKGVLFQDGTQEPPVKLLFSKDHIKGLLPAGDILLLSNEQELLGNKGSLCDSGTEETPTKEKTQFHKETWDFSKGEKSSLCSGAEKPLTKNDIFTACCEPVASDVENEILDRSCCSAELLPDEEVVVERKEYFQKFDNETLEGSLDKKLGCFKTLIQRSKLLKQGIRDELVHINSNETTEDNSSQNNDLEEFDQSFSYLMESSTADSKEHYKALLLFELNNALRRQVKTLRNEVCHLKKANYCLSEYGDILKTCEVQSVQLVGEKQQVNRKAWDLNETIMRLKEDQTKQENLIMGLQCNNAALAAKIEALQLDALREEQLVEVLRELERKINDLNDVNSNIILEKKELENCNRNLVCALENIKKELAEKEAANKSFQMQLEKSTAEHRALQEEHSAVIQERDKFIHLSAELEGSLCQKEMGIEYMKTERSKAEAELNSLRSSLQRLKEEKENVDQQLLSLTADLDQYKAEREAEKEQLRAKYAKLVSELELLQDECENEQTETEKLKYEIDAVRSDNVHLQELVAKEKEQKQSLRREANKWKHQLEKVIQTQAEKGMKLVRSDLSSDGEAYERDCINFTCVQRASQLLSKINSLLALTEGILVCQETDTVSSGQTENSAGGRVCELKEKIKHLDSKKEALEKELQKRRASVPDLTELNRKKITEDLAAEDANTISATMEGSRNTMDQFRKKLDENHKLINEQNELLKSFTEMVHLANQKLQMYNIQIIRLEAANQELRNTLKKQFREYTKEKESRTEAALEMSESQKLPRISCWRKN
uniref:Cancer antigen 1 n=1 Tax=Latimeria chalumnae TaxID=7897 RepID=H3AYU8_LATCH